MERASVLSLSGMSPRRRALVTAVAAVLAVALVVLAVQLAWSWYRSDTRTTPAQDRPGTVLLVPGYGGGTGGLDVLAGVLRVNGRTATVVQLPDQGTGDLHRQADTVDRYADQALRDGATSVDVIGYSAGGVVARLWAQEHDGAHKARRIVTLGSPHHGAQLAAAGTALVPGACPTACQQLAPGSRLLAQLTTPVPDPPRWLSVWTAQDETVRPAESARLDGALNIMVQDLCPRRQVSHGGLPTDGVVTALVLGAIGAGPIATPAPLDCARG